MTEHTPESTQPQYITLRGRAIDISGQRFGRLIALGPIGRNAKGKIIWLCQCDCGNKSTTVGHYLTAGDTKSCGCFQQENRVTTNTTHNLHDHPLYRIWRAIKDRCTNPKCPPYNSYGGRGISLCKEWQNDFKAFHDYVTALEYYGKPGYTIDRIDNDGNYEPGNLRYATRREQAQNTRSYYDGGSMRGEEHPLSKLTTDTVRYIRELAESGKPVRAIAREMNLGRSTVRQIVLRKTWKHVE